MSEPFLERLSRFTPDAGRLDRDALLFAAGRSSARPNRGWIWLSAVLASTQVFALALLSPRSAGIAPGQHESVVQSSAPPKAVHDAKSLVSASSHIWSVRHEMNETPLDDRMGESLALVESEPILHAFGLPRSSAAN